MIVNELAEKMGYHNLLAGILRQTIQDYVLAKRKLMNGQKTAQRYSMVNRIKSCESFFADPPYDYGDVDFVYLKRLCDEKVADGGRVFYRDNDIREWKKKLNS